MNLKKKLRNFFAMSRKANGGFTLVELIVVIAILAILSGVAVLAYTGYIAKANRAADEVLLAALNKAYASACLENGRDALVTPGYATLAPVEGGNKVGKVTSYYDNDGAYFAKYYKDNEDSVFKVFTNLVWKDGMFVPEDASNYEFGGKKYNYQQSDIDAYISSNFQKIGVDKTLDLIDSLVAMVMGASYEDPDTGEIMGAVASLQKDTNFTKFLEDNGLNAEDNAQVATGLAFYAAEKIASADPNAIAAAMTGNASVDIDNMYKAISGNDNPTYSEKAVSAAIMYAMTASYAESDYAPEGTALPTGSETIANAAQLADYLSDYYSQPGFKEYLASSTAVDDMAGLVGVMSTLDTNDENVLGIVKDEDYKFNGDDYLLSDLINGLLGNQ